MNRPPSDPLLNAILADQSLETLRAQSLEQSLALVRSRGRRRRWAQGGLVLALFAVLGLLLSVQRRPSENAEVVSAPAPTRPSPTAPSGDSTGEKSGVQFISDEELLALFPGRPLALFGPPGRKTLVFLDQPAAHQ